MICLDRAAPLAGADRFPLVVLSNSSQNDRLIIPNSESEVVNNIG